MSKNHLNVSKFLLITLSALAISCNHHNDVMHKTGSQYIKGDLPNEQIAFNDSTDTYYIKYSSSHSESLYTQSVTFSNYTDSINAFDADSLVIFSLGFSESFTEGQPTNQEIDQIFKAGRYTFQTSDINEGRSEGVSINYFSAKNGDNWTSYIGNNDNSYFEILEVIDDEKKYPNYPAVSTHKVIRGRLSCNLYFAEFNDPEHDFMEKIELKNAEFYLRTAIY